MYVGRIVAIGKNRSGKVCALYRVSSRSFPNREAKAIGDNIAVVPRSGFEDDVRKNPFVVYNCLSIVNSHAVVSNGSHTDFLALKLREKYTMRDALVTVLHTFDYEHDSLNTPRIAGIVDRQSGTGCLGIVTKKSLLVEEFELAPGKLYYIATYEHNRPDDKYTDTGFDAKTADAACQYILEKGVFSSLEKPVTAACTVESDSDNFEVSVANP